MNTPNESAKVSEDNVTLNDSMAYQLDEFYLDLQEDGNHIRLLSAAEIKESPFPGLRPYRTSEFQLFKGRGGQAEELIRRLQNNKFLAVIGSSGTGKSSLVRAGLIPQLFGGYLHGTGSSWDVAICRPGADPIENLSIALTSIQTGSRSREVIGPAFDEIHQRLLKSIYGLLDVGRLINAGRDLGEKRNLLVIIDQFEELFRFTTRRGLMEGQQVHFVNLLLKAAATAEDPVYVITTMRSEFLGDCVRFQGLPEAINKGQYLVPQLDRPQLREVIESPLALAEKTIAPGLIELLINKIEENKLKDNLDQLPILQHALMRTYQQSNVHGNVEEIVYEDYKAVGGMEESLSRHASDKFRELGDNDSETLSKKQLIAKYIFQALTDQSRGGQKGGRRPLPLHQIYKLCSSIAASPDEVNAVIEHFRSTDTSFLMPPPSTPLSPDLVIDISHESLMRNWVELRTWINEETANGKLYARLNERRELYEQDNSDVIKGVLLRELKELRERINITAAWASRYHQNPPEEDSAESYHEAQKEKNMAFLDYSILQENAEAESQKLQLEKEVRQQERERTRRKVMFVLSSALILTLAVALWAIYQKMRANTSLVNERKSLALAQKEEIEADKYYAEAMKANQSLVKSQIELKKQVSHNALLVKSLLIISAEVASQKKAIELQLTINTLQKEPFYHINDLSEVTRDEMLKDVLKGKLERSGTVDVQRYIDKNKLMLLNKAAVAFDTIPVNATLGLRIADTLWRLHSENIFLRQIIGSIFETNLFPDNTQYLGDEENLKISPAGPNDFYLMGSDSLYALHYDPNGNKIGMNHAYRIAHGPFGWQAYSLVGNNSYLALDGGKLISWDHGRESVLDSIRSPNYAIFTTGGKQLITSFQDTIKIWNLDSAKGEPGRGKMKAQVLTTKRYVKGLTVSPDGKNLLIQTSEFDEVWDISRKVKLTKRNSYYLRGTNYVGFTPENNRLLIAMPGHIALSNFEGDRLDDISWSLPGNNSNLVYETLRIDKMILSADWKRVILLSSGGAFLIESGADSILHAVSMGNRLKSKSTRQSTDQTVKVKKFTNGSTVIKDAQFVGKLSAVMTDEHGQMSLWNTVYDWKANINKSFSRLTGLTKVTEDERLERGLLTYEAVMRSNDIRLVRKSASFFLKKAEDDFSRTMIDNLVKSKALFKHALELDHSNRRSIELKQIATINEQMIAMMSQVSLSIYSKKAELSTENIYVYEDYLTLVPNEIEAKRLLASSYGSLAFYKIFARDNAGAIVAAKRGLELNPDATWIYTNLALANLLLGNYPEAEKLYLSYKDVLYNNQPIGLSFLDDFAKMEETAIITGREPEVLKIKKFLNNNP